VELPVLNMAGKVVSQAQVSDRVFAAPSNPDLLHQVMVYHQANQRQGTSNTKTRAMVAGGGRKPFAQKGTGRARQGTIRAPHMRHGGVVFGPHPRDYSKRIPKKMRRQAIRCALSAKANGDRLVLVDGLSADSRKTSAMASVLKALGVEKSALLVVSESSRDVSMAARNLPRIKTLTADLVNVLDLMRYDRVVMTVDAVRRAEALWGDAEDVVGTGVGEI
jgi:large subunit ribosomal protein L4